MQINSKLICRLFSDALNYSDFDISVLITTNKTIRDYNRDYRNKDKPTDILSFPTTQSYKRVNGLRLKHEEDKNLGDLIISAEYVTKDAKELKVTFEARMKKFLVHGVCHLLGYDHIIDCRLAPYLCGQKKSFLFKKNTVTK